MDIMVIYDMIPKANMHNHVKNHSKDHLIILREFLGGNKVHTLFECEQTVSE